MKIPRLAVTPAVVANVIVTLMTAACDGGDGSGLPPAGNLGPNFSEIQASVFTPNCATTGCHFGAGAPQGLRLDETSSHALLVGVPSAEEPGILRVAPGDPNNSYLVQKLEGTASTGQQMPLNAPALPQSTIDVIRQWIAEGAIDDRAPANNAIRVTSLSPVPDSQVDPAPAQIIAAFDREPDASTVNAMTFLLEASGGDATFDDGNEIPVQATAISVPPANPRSAVFDLTGMVLPPETYRVRLKGSGPSLILDLDANALDGEFSGMFPSGDGSQGGDFTATFTVRDPAVPEPTLDSIQAAVFGPTCGTAGCHTGGGANLPGAMNLTSAQASFDNLVNVASLQSPGAIRVIPNDPDNSYLVQKLEGTAAVGARMPFGSPDPLDPAVIASIRQWIADGALR
ncbi:MAG: hypothetical protein R3192_10825 [Woeseiaceae bacterium]|nr:hypothetical protein [Woeseiaceae bacterium]